MLRRAFFLLIVSMLCPAVLAADKAQSISWRTDLKSAQTEMQQTQRPMLLYITMPGCVYCERMKAETFNQKRIADQVNEQYVPVQINGPKHSKITKQLNLRVYPTTAIVHPNGKVLEVLHGFQPAAKFVKRMAVAKAKLGNIKVAAKRQVPARN